ncbi:UDP-N-acetylenolpyruvoylglucosamine reductase [Bienertia sinuspersici]
MAGSTSSQSSGVTGGDLSGCGEQEEISDLELLDKEPTSSEWTDEKHSLYLKSIENSFVNQLYSSMESSGLYSQMNCPSDMKSSRHKKSHTFDQRIEVGRGEPPPQRAGNGRFLLQNPWIQHYRSRGREDRNIKGTSSFGNQPMNCGERTMYARALANMSDTFPIGQTVGDSSIGEGFSGQNFDEDDNEARTCSLHTSKRMKTVEAVSLDHE